MRGGRNVLQAHEREKILEPNYEYGAMLERLKIHIHQSSGYPNGAESFLITRASDRATLLVCLFAIDVT